MCRRARFGCTGSRNVDKDMSAVVVAVAVADFVGDVAAAVVVVDFVADLAAAVAIAAPEMTVAVVVVGLFAVALRDNRLDQIASTFSVVSCQKTIQSGLRFSAWSE